jgi:leucyl-tRNA synthetase
VSAIVLNKKGELLLLRWPEYKWLTGVIGGIENGETAEQAAEREVFEETGYKARAIFAAPIQIESHFYAEHKNEWRARIDTPVLLELIDEEAKPIAQDEAAKHQVEWTNIDAALASEMFRNNKIAIELALGRFAAYTAPRHGESQVLVNSGDFNGKSVDDAKKEITEKYGRGKTTYKLRDWIVSRQRYWGVPIPIIHCAKCGHQPVADEQLPVLLPDVEDYLPEGSGKSPLAKNKAFVKTVCPQCGGAAERETDTLDTFVDSSWYFLRYTDPQNSDEFASANKQKNWMPVNLYCGGA